MRETRKEHMSAIEATINLTAEWCSEGSRDGRECVRERYRTPGVCRMLTRYPDNLKSPLVTRLALTYISFRIPANF